MDKKKILLVDDEPDFLEVIKIRLEANGYEVITASNGKEALETLKKEKVDAVLLDILMPQMNGIEALKNIRQDNKQLPVFMLTAYSDKINFSLANELGASGYIVKTSDLQKEIENVNAVLRVADKYKPQER